MSRGTFLRRETAVESILVEVHKARDNNPDRTFTLSLAELSAATGVHAGYIGYLTRDLSRQLSDLIVDRIQNSDLNGFLFSPKG